jgi:hypothetical protein
LQSVVKFASAWIDPESFEEALGRAIPPHDSLVTDILFYIPIGCKLMVVPIVRLLSLANQLCLGKKRVTLDFRDGEDGAMGYLNRIGFFDHLSDAAEVLPYRPSQSGAQLHFGANSGVVEIAAIGNGRDIKRLPNRLAQAVTCACAARLDVKTLANSAWQIFSELIDNIAEHSSSEIDGYAALQVYRGGNALQVAVSDSGVGIMETLRPGLRRQSRQYAGMSDVELLVEVFRQGISRHGPDTGRGCGLKSCAERAIKFRAELDVRLGRQRVRLSPGDGGYRPNLAHCSEDLPLLEGTHISFAFELA